MEATLFGCDSMKSFFIWRILCTEATFCQRLQFERLLCARLFNLRLLCKKLHCVEATLCEGYFVWRLLYEELLYLEATLCVCYYPIIGLYLIFTNMLLCVGANLRRASLFGGYFVLRLFNFGATLCGGYFMQGFFFWRLLCKKVLYVEATL